MKAFCRFINVCKLGGKAAFASGLLVEVLADRDESVKDKSGGVGGAMALLSTRRRVEGGVGNGTKGGLGVGALLRQPDAKGMQ